jgi:hypothetical protein
MSTESLSTELLMDVSFLLLDLTSGLFLVGAGEY